MAIFVCSLSLNSKEFYVNIVENVKCSINYIEIFI